MTRRSFRRAAMAALLGALLTAGRLEAQHALPMPRPSLAWNHATELEQPLASRRSAGSSQSYWREGLIIGGVLGGIAGGALAGGMCGDSDSGYSGGCVGPAIGGALVGALIGAVSGLLIGGRFKKQPKARTEPSQ